MGTKSLWNRVRDEARNRTDSSSAGGDSMSSRLEMKRLSVFTAPKSGKLGKVFVELVVDNFSRRTDHFVVAGEERVKIDKKLLMPVPTDSSGMIVRVWREGGIQPQALIGEANVLDAADTNIQISLCRKGEHKGWVMLRVAPTL